jgi:TonB family protein
MQIDATRTQGTAATTRSMPSMPAPNYPDSTGGLEKLTKDILRALKQGNRTEAEQLVQSLVLPNPAEWYPENFGSGAADDAQNYQKIAKMIPFQLLDNFMKVAQENDAQIEATRYEKSCDDNASEETFGILQRRVQPIPMYELRVFRGRSFTRFFAFVFAQGAFRFIIPPKPGLPNVSSTQAASPSAANAKTDKGENHSDMEGISVLGPIQAAKLIHRVDPKYPEIARGEGLQGEVTLHAIVGRDGTIRDLYVMKGSCSLAEAAYKAVRQWRYSPTLVNGRPVEVDTTIRVNFLLRH